MKKLEHKNAVKILGYGAKGKIHTGGEEYNGLTYIIMEYVSCESLYGLTDLMKGMAEDAARFFLN